MNKPTSVELMADTTERFTVDELAATFPNSELVRLSQTVLQETPADYDVGEFSEAAREAEPIERLQPLHRDFLEPGKRRARLSPSMMQAMLAQFSKFMFRI